MDNNEDPRLYYRFKIDHPKLCYVKHNGIHLGSVTEISYGGFSLASSGKTTPFQKNPDTVELYFLDKSIFCQVEQRHNHLNKTGYQLKHEQTLVLSFLKEIIPWIRAGSALSYLQKLEREGFEQELPEYLTFEGPIPIEIEWLGLDSHKSPNFSLSFTQDKVVYQLKKLNEQLETLHNVWPGGESGDLRSTLSLDTTILRNGLAILVGLSSYGEASTYSQLIDSIISLYENWASDSNKRLTKKTA